MRTQGDGGTLRFAVPADFAAWRVRADGPQGQAWINGLPALLQRLCTKWGLTPDDTAMLHGGGSVVLLVHRGETALALRVSHDPERVADEVIALRTWAGRGAVQLVEADAAAGATLLQRLDPHRSLHALPLPQAATVAGRLIQTLAVPAVEGLRALSEEAQSIASLLPARQAAAGYPVPERWLQRACAEAAALAKLSDDVLIHADLHYGNVLADQTSSTHTVWLTIDPRPFNGRREYCIPELMWTRADELTSPGQIVELLTILSAAGGLDVEQARAWTTTRCVDYWLCGRERGLTADPARCQKVLVALLRTPH